jgi:dipeptidase D
MECQEHIMERGKLSKVEPKEVFGFFEEICNIPHGSKNISQISNYLVNFAKERKLNYIQDKYKNVIITKEASKGYEDIPPIILQGHMDMVTVQTPEDTKNMETDGLDVDISGDYIYARNTSLGGDDGIALAYSLALLASDTISHPKLEVIFTVDEEVGMDGAREIDLSTLEGKRLINIDSEEEGYLLAGCAGGGTISGSIPISREHKKGREIVISITNLKGGHSGVEIDKERGNALYLLSRILRNVKKEIEFSLLTFEGGEKDNAIPCFAMAKIILANENIDKFSDVFDKISGMIKKEFA